MIGVNPLRRPVLITTDEVVFHASTNNDVDVRIILNSIIVAEVRFIKPLLGHVLYGTFIENKNLLVTTANKAGLQTQVNADRPADREAIVLNVGDYVNSDTFLTTEQQDLWSMYLHKIVAECVWFTALPVNRSRFTGKGVEQNNPVSIGSDKGVQAVDLKDLKHLMDAGLQHRITPLIEDLHNYMCRVRYPGYTRNCDCDSQGARIKKKSDMVLNIYDSKPRRRSSDCCNDSFDTAPGYVTTPINETIPFNDVSELIIPWNLTRRTKYGDSAVFAVEVLEDGVYHIVSVEVVADATPLTTYYRIDFSGISTGRVTIS